MTGVFRRMAVGLSAGCLGILGSCAPVEIASVDLLRAEFTTLTQTDIAPPDVIVDEPAAGVYVLPGPPEGDVLEFRLRRDRARATRRSDPGTPRVPPNTALTGEASDAFGETIFRFVPAQARLPNPTGLFLYSFEIRPGTVGEVRISLDRPVPSVIPLVEFALRLTPDGDQPEFEISGETLGVSSPDRFQNVLLTLDTREIEGRDAPELIILAGGRSRTVPLPGIGVYESAPSLNFVITSGFFDIDTVIVLESTTAAFPG